MPAVLEHETLAPQVDVLPSIFENLPTGILGLLSRVLRKSRAAPIRRRGGMWTTIRRTMTSRIGNQGGVGTAKGHDLRNAKA